VFVVNQFANPLLGGAGVGLSVALLTNPPRPMGTPPRRGLSVFLLQFLGLNSGAEWLGNAIMGVDLTPESARSAITQADEFLKSLAFATIIKNRVNRGGNLANGASLTKNGENGKGITSRWHPETLRRQILAITQVKH
jgi:DNA adenine methylase